MGLLLLWFWAGMEDVFTLELDLGAVYARDVFMCELCASSC